VTLHRDLNILYLKTAGCSVLGALPLALIGVPGPLQLVGLLYAVFWAAIVVPSAGLYMLLLVDPVLLALDRPALFLPRLLAAAQQRSSGHVRTTIRRVRGYAELANWINPLGNLVVAAYWFAARANPRRFAEAGKQAERIQQAWQQLESSGADPMTEVARPVGRWIDAFEKELQPSC
jgi:hypothetical protein